MSRFKVGEIAIIARADSPREKFIGEECEIMRVVGGYSYVINVPSCKSESSTGFWECDEIDLKKKDDPEQTTTWEAIEQEFNWNPNKQRVEEHG